MTLSPISEASWGSASGLAMGQCQPPACQRLASAERLGEARNAAQVATAVIIYTKMRKLSNFFLTHNFEHSR